VPPLIVADAGYGVHDDLDRDPQPGPVGDVPYPVSGVLTCLAWQAAGPAVTPRQDQRRTLSPRCAGADTHR
jgi:hypothetical protein